ncbi:MAG TPA: hypothetical protein VGZ22_15905 [Isosphaeraceae bacterium]|jgi:hypothetical protein|nr:hypothetical protein [Isosphaeraceae bacterium]
MPANFDALPALLAELASVFLENNLNAHRAELVKKLGHNLLERHLIENHFSDAISQVRPQVEAFISSVLTPVLESAKSLAAQPGSSSSFSE